MNDELMTNPFGIYCTDKLISVDTSRFNDSNCISLDCNSLRWRNDYELSEVVKNAVKEAIQENNIHVAPEIEKYHIKHK